MLPVFLIDLAIKVIYFLSIIFLISKFWSKFQAIALIIFLSLATSMSAIIFRGKEILAICFCPRAFEVFNKLLNSDKRRFDFFYKFSAKFGLFEDNFFFILSFLCFVCWRSFERVNLECFIRYFLENEEMEPINFE